uniref:Uncharacterized protein n=1 Tax=Odontella aurita TaxID=265563 RepID=A0A7S4I990_9STRA|mmetsp:Transcript_21650/g.63589  ORF Transcript_21650/g.63589 Transcript_21650/m.63589 type:complete len:713 (+) Transcript_21650:44-2182(+)
MVAPVASIAGARGGGGRPRSNSEMSGMSGRGDDDFDAVLASLLRPSRLAGGGGAKRGKKGQGQQQQQQEQQAKKDPQSMKLAALTSALIETARERRGEDTSSMDDDDDGWRGSSSSSSFAIPPGLTDGAGPAVNGDAMPQEEAEWERMMRESMMDLEGRAATTMEKEGSSTGPSPKLSLARRTERAAAAAAGGSGNGIGTESQKPTTLAEDENENEAEWERMIRESSEAEGMDGSMIPHPDEMDPDEFQSMLDSIQEARSKGEGGKEELARLVGGAKGRVPETTPKDEAMLELLRAREMLRPQSGGGELDDLEEEDYDALMDALDPTKRRKVESGEMGVGGGGDGGVEEDFDAKAQELMKNFYSSEEVLGGGEEEEDPFAPKLQPLVAEEGGWMDESMGAATRVMERPVEGESMTGEMVLPADYEQRQGEIESTAVGFPSHADDTGMDMSQFDDASPSSEEVAAKDPVLAQLEQALPGMPPQRLKRLRDLFGRSLGDPSMLRLVPILRENMPPTATPGWLKRKNLHDARVAMQSAEDEGRVNMPLMNSMLKVETTCGSLDRAMAFHEREFEANGLRPTEYSDRLVLDMLVRCHRLSRALSFKDRVEAEGRNLDLLSYGTLVEYLGKRGQLGSALMMLRECVAVHGAPPGEKALKKIRTMCRHRGLEKELSLTDMIGEDPTEWIWEGTTQRRTDRSYRARRELQLPENRVLQA